MEARVNSAVIKDIYFATSPRFVVLLWLDG